MTSIPMLLCLLLMMFSVVPDEKFTNGSTLEAREVNTLVRKGDVAQWAVGFGNVENEGFDEELEYQTILTYINTLYTKINFQDATLISRSVVNYSKEQSLDPKLVAAVIAKESAFNKSAVSASGAKGLGQILDPKSFNLQDPFDIKENASVTVSYLKRLLSVWKDKTEQVVLALASYYQGPTAIRKKNGELDADSRAYVSGILKHYNDLRSLRQTLQAK